MTSYERPLSLISVSCWSKASNPNRKQNNILKHIPGFDFYIITLLITFFGAICIILLGVSWTLMESGPGSPTRHQKSQKAKTKPHQQPVFTAQTGRQQILSSCICRSDFSKYPETKPLTMKHGSLSQVEVVGLQMSAHKTHQHVNNFPIGREVTFQQQSHRGPTLRMLKVVPKKSL